MTNKEHDTLTKFLSLELGYEAQENDVGAVKLEDLAYQLGRRSHRLYHIVRKASGSILSGRTTSSLMSYIDDILEHNAPGVTSLQSRMPLRVTQSINQKINSGWDRRALGSSSKRFKDSVLSTMGPSKAYTYMSGDVGAIAFAHNSNIFVAGSVCDETASYNNPGNLVLGDADNQVLHNLDYHWKPPRLGQNTSTERTHYTVSMSDFSADGRHLFSAGYDGWLRAFTINDGSNKMEFIDSDTTVSLTGQAAFGAPVDLLRTNRVHGKIAVGAQLIKNSISIYECSDNGVLGLQKHMQTAADRQIHPTCLQWGPGSFSNYLVAGFMDAGDDIKTGEFAMWDVNAEQRIPYDLCRAVVFDVNWSPHGHLFAAAMRPHAMVNKSAKSVVRIYDQRLARPINDYDCLAKDINDVVFSPHDENIVAAGTTEGNIYVWDRRNYHDLLCTLRHSPPIDSSAEKDDTGVRFCAWNESRHGLVTGSSDGYLKSWDMYRSPNDMHVEDLAVFSSGIFSGAFSSDYRRLAIGEVKKTFTIFEPFNKGRSMNDLDGFKILNTSSYTKVGEAPEQKTSRTRGPGECSLDKCLAVEALEDYEDIEDSRRWEGRIPANLIKTLNDLDVAAGHMGKIKAIHSIRKCQLCGGAARPSAEVEKPFCEACAFACFRCGERRPLSDDMKHIVCACGEWTVGALGYDLVVPRDLPNDQAMDIDHPRLNHQTVTHIVPGLVNDSNDEDDESDDGGLLEMYQQKWTLKVWNRMDSCYHHLNCNKAVRPTVEGKVEEGKDYCTCTTSIAW